MNSIQALVSRAAAGNGENVATVYDDGRTAVLITYKELLNLAHEVTKALQLHVENNDVVAVCVPTSEKVPMYLLGIMEASAAFFYINPNDLHHPTYYRNILKELHVKLLMMDSACLEVQWIADLQPVIIPSPWLAEQGVVLLRLPRKTLPKAANVSLAYAVTTSGTTGTPKVVKVPHQCIIPNLLDFRQIFSVTSCDRVFCASPLTFDPSMVEIFTSLISGAAVIFTSDEVKVAPQRLLDVIYHRQQVTILQVTPTLLSRFSPQCLKSTLLAGSSKLKVLAFGGETCPDPQTITSWCGENNKTRFFNLYGITEVSSWASCYEICVSNLNGGLEEIFLGDPLSDTVFEIRDEDGETILGEGEGDMFIGGRKRVCLLDDEVAMVENTFRSSGDIIRRGNHSRLIYLGRKDDQVKRYGKRMNLGDIEKAALRCSGISHAVAVFNHNKILLFISSVGHSWEDSLNRTLIDQLPGHAQPDLVVLVGEFPMTKHGKVDKRKLMTEHNVHVKCRKSPEYLVRGLLGLPLVPADAAFPSLGGNSILALQFVTEVEEEYGQEVPELMDTLLHKPLQEVYELINGLVSPMSKGLKCQDLRFCGDDGSEEGEGTKVGKPSTIASNSTGEIVDGSDLTYVGRLRDIGSKNASDLMGRSSSGNSDVKFGSAVTESSRDTRDFDCDMTNICDKEEQSQDLGSGDNSVSRIIKRHISESEESEVRDVKRLCGCTDVAYPESCVEGHGANSSHANCEEMPFEIGKHGPCGECERLRRKKLYFVIQRGCRYTSVVCQRCGCQSYAQQNKFSGLSCARSHLEEPGGFRDSQCNSVVVDREEDCEKISSYDPSRDSNVTSSGDGYSAVKAEGCKQKCAMEVTEKWRYNTGKCVDASPLVIVNGGGQGHAYVGSHSHQFSAVSLDTGRPLWETMLGGRIESSACLSKCGKYIIVGCYNHKVYVIEKEYGRIQWTFSTGAEVKSSPTVDLDTGLVYFGAHDQCVYALDVQAQSCIWKAELNCGSIYSSVCLDKPSNHLYVCSLGGKIMALNPLTGDVYWTYITGKPIFSSPSAWCKGVVFGCVDGYIYCLDHSGNLMWKYLTGGPVFSSPSIIQGEPHVRRTNHMIVCGSHDFYVYCLNQSGQCEWRFKADSPVFATPFSFPFKIEEFCRPELDTEQIPNSQFAQPKNIGILSVVDNTGVNCPRNLPVPSDCCSTDLDLDMIAETSKTLGKCRDLICVFSTNGKMFVLDGVSGLVLYEQCLPGEVFSSPVVYGDRIIVGCRDDFLYSLQSSAPLSTSVQKWQAACRWISDKPHTRKSRW